MLTAISTAFHQGSWGMWPILFTSVVTIAIIVERAVYLFRASVDKDKLLALLKSQVMSGNVQGAIKVCSGNPTPMTRIVQAGLMKFNRSDAEVQAAMDGAAPRRRARRDARPARRRRGPGRDGRGPPARAAPGQRAHALPRHARQLRRHGRSARHNLRHDR